jgi:NAD-dependent DNA ligase
LSKNRIGLENPIAVEIIKRFRQLFESELPKEILLAEVKTVLVQATGNEFTSTGCVENFSCTLFDDDIQTVKGKKCCFTGKFAKKRSELEDQFESIGALVQNAMSDTTDILIVGGEVSRDWKFSSAGRKIEHAVKNKSSGKDTLICSERKMNEFLKKLRLL